MLGRIIQLIRDHRDWRRQHERAWGGQDRPGEGGSSPFQRACEAAVVEALSARGLGLTERAVAGTTERQVRARVGQTPWTLRIYTDGVELSAGQATAARLERWDARTPEELIATLVARTLEVAGVAQPRAE